MRKTIVYMLCAAMLCVCLCGCGNQDQGQSQGQGQNDMAIGTPVVPDMTPMVSPIVTPDLEDGHVDDTDGIIEDKDETKQDHAASGDEKKGTTTVSPSPEVTREP